MVNFTIHYLDYFRLPLKAAMQLYEPLLPEQSPEQPPFSFDLPQQQPWLLPQQALTPFTGRHRQLSELPEGLGTPTQRRLPRAEHPHRMSFLGLRLKWCRGPLERLRAVASSPVSANFAQLIAGYCLAQVPELIKIKFMLVSSLKFETPPDLPRFSFMCPFVVF